MSTNQITILAPAQRDNKNGKPIQLLFVALMIAWMMLGPIMDDCAVGQSAVVAIYNSKGHKTYGTVCDAEEAEEHVLIATWC